MKRQKLPAFLVAAKMGFKPWLNADGQVAGRYGIKAVPGQYVRAIAMSGDFWQSTLSVGFVSQLRTVGSGGGFTYSPGSGSVSV